MQQEQPPEFTLYILRCADGSLYTGHTETLEPRLTAHNRGDIPGYAATRRPVHLLWSTTFPTRAEALAAERQVKRWTRAKKEALINGDWALLHQLAKSVNKPADPTRRTPNPSPRSP